MSVFINDNPGSPPIREVHIWIGHNMDGTESMMAADFEIVAGEIRHMPLMSGRRDLAEKLQPTAEHVMKLSRHLTTKIVRLELRTFKAEDDS